MNGEPRTTKPRPKSLPSFVRQSVAAKGKRMTRKHAAHLVKQHPTLSHLKSSLRKRGLLE